MALRFLLCLSRNAVARVSVGDLVPDKELHRGYPPEKVKLRDLCAGQKVVLVGVPGAFTPSSNQQVGGYMAKQGELKKLGVDRVLVIAVQDGAVMSGWEDSHKAKGSLLSFVSDTNGGLTEALGLELTDEGSLAMHGGVRSRRYSMLVEDGRIKAMNVAVSDGDPLGEKDPTSTLVEKMIEELSLQAPAGSGDPGGAKKAGSPAAAKKKTESSSEEEESEEEEDSSDEDSTKASETQPQGVKAKAAGKASPKAKA